MRKCATHVNGSAYNCKCAFTLAEVLITLGVIGIVAAMTLPGILAKQRAKSLEAFFKKRYSEVSQAILRIKKDDIQVYNTYYGEQLQKVLYPQFPNTKNLPRSLVLLNASNQKNYIGFSLPKYKTYDRQTDFNTSLLDDGIIVVNKEFFIYINTDNNSTINTAITIDINGLKEPNIFGYDVFVFRLDETDTLRAMGKNDSLCSRTPTGNNRNGWSCSYYAMTDKDYFKNLPYN